MYRYSLLILAWLLTGPPPSLDNALVIDAGRYLLGSGSEAEWESFDGTARHGPELDLHFRSRKNHVEHTLFIRQEDVKSTWQVRLNGNSLGTLHTMEYPLVRALAVPPGALLEGENTLTLSGTQTGDDILVGRVELEPRPVSDSLTQGSLEVEVKDRDLNLGLACRITVVDETGALAALQTPPAQGLAVRTGVVYSMSGRARIGLRPGRYTVFASRGFEYGVDRREITLSPGEVRHLALRIRQEVSTPGWAAADTHVHTYTYSGHGDATAEERMVTVAGEGLEIPVATDHNRFVDYSAYLSAMGSGTLFTPATGAEITTRKGHFNIFPVPAGSPLPDVALEDWPVLMEDIRSKTGARVIVLNHPRDVHGGFRPFDASVFNPVTGSNRRGSDFTFNALEVLNSGALQSDVMQLYRDWFVLLNRGYRITAVAGSDSHDVSRYIVGQARTYVQCPDSEPGRLDLELATRSFLEGRVRVSMGLLVELTVNGRDRTGSLARTNQAAIPIEISVLGPSWTAADRVDLYANGVKVLEIAVPPTPRIEKARIVRRVPLPRHDVFLVAVASGPGVGGPFWPVPKPYQPSSRTWTPRVVGSAGPVWLDRDGDGRFTPAREYARSIIQRSGTAAESIIPALADCDESVAAQAAALLHQAGADILAGSFARHLDRAAASVQRGFAAYAGTLKGRGSR